MKLDIVGSLWDESYVRDLIARLKLSESVTVHSFVDEEDLDRIIASAHLAFHLRVPTMGEASGGVLRSWSNATPVVVTDSGWFAELPDHLVVKIPPTDEVEHIRSTLCKLDRDPVFFREMGEAAQGHVSEAHSPNRYAEQLRRLLNGYEEASARLAELRTMLAVGARATNRQLQEALIRAAGVNMHGVHGSGSLSGVISSLTCCSQGSSMDGGVDPR